MEKTFEVQIRIEKAVADVFNAVVEPDRLSRYFVQTSSGPLVEGSTVMWKFAEHPDSFEVHCRQRVDNERLVFQWEAGEGGYDTTVQMTFAALEDGATMVQVAEAGWADNEAGTKSSYRNCGGWMHMLCALKALLDHNINLREGSIVDCDG